MAFKESLSFPTFFALELRFRVFDVPNGSFWVEQSRNHYARDRRSELQGQAAPTVLAVPKLFVPSPVGTPPDL